MGHTGPDSHSAAVPHGLPTFCLTLPEPRVLASALCSAAVGTVQCDRNPRIQRNGPLLFPVILARLDALAAHGAHTQLSMFSLAFSAEGILASSTAIRAYPRPSSIHVVALADGVGPESWLEDVSDAEDAALDAFLSELSDDPPAPVRYASLVDRETQQRPIRPRPGTSALTGQRSSRKPPPRQTGRPNGRRRQLAMPVAPQSGVPRPVYDAPDGDGIERSSFGGQLTVLVPTKVMAFIDGSWLYYTLFERGRRCPIVQRYGAGWYHSHHVDWTAITQLISDHISAELLRMQPYNERAIEVPKEQSKPHPHPHRLTTHPSPSTLTPTPTLTRSCACSSTPASARTSRSAPSAT